MKSLRLIPMRESTRSVNVRPKRSLRLVGALLLVAAGCLVACDREASRGVDIVSRTTVTGVVNGSPLSGTISATLNTRRGGSSTCEFDRLPTGFTPATINTHT